MNTDELRSMLRELARDFAMPIMRRPPISRRGCAGQAVTIVADSDPAAFFAGSELASIELEEEEPIVVYSKATTPTEAGSGVAAAVLLTVEYGSNEGTLTISAIVPQPIRVCARYVRVRATVVDPSTLKPIANRSANVTIDFARGNAPFPPGYQSFPTIDTTDLAVGWGFLPAALPGVTIAKPSVLLSGFEVLNVGDTLSYLMLFDAPTLIARRSQPIIAPVPVPAAVAGTTGLIPGYVIFDYATQPLAFTSGCLWVLSVDPTGNGSPNPPAECRISAHGLQFT